MASGTCPRYIHQGFTTDSRWNWDRCTIIKLTNMGEKYVQESDLRIWVKNMFRNWSWLWVHKIVLTGGLPAPQTSWRGACSPPRPLAQFLRGSASQALRFFGYKILVPGTARQGNIWPGTDHKDTARKYLARHGSTRSGHGTARDVPGI